MQTLKKRGRNRMIGKLGVELMQEKRTITRQRKFKKKIQESGEKR